MPFDNSLSDMKCGSLPRRPILNLLFGAVFWSLTLLAAMSPRQAVAVTPEVIVWGDTSAGQNLVPGGLTNIIMVAAGGGTQVPQTGARESGRCRSEGAQRDL